MGCCVSSATADKKEDSSGKNSPPPPSFVEEETIVKEVLSETTLLANDNNSTVEKTTTTTTEMIKISEKEEEEEEEKKPGIVDVALDPVLTEPGLVEPKKGSEVCSLSESLLSIVNGLEEEAKQMKSQEVRQRSPAKSRSRVVGNYPTRRTDMSPCQRNTGGEGAGSVRLVQSGKREPTELRSERRSRSPAMNRNMMRKQSQSPGRVRPNPIKNNGSEQDCHQIHHQWPSCGAPPTGNYNSAPNDSFENPLVSLECFIFL